jgi:hypothetical protein
VVPDLIDAASEYFTDDEVSRKTTAQGRPDCLR